MDYSALNDEKLLHQILYHRDPEAFNYIMTQKCCSYFKALAEHLNVDLELLTQDLTNFFLENDMTIFKNYIVEWNIGSGLRSNPQRLPLDKYLQINALKWSLIKYPSPQVSCSTFAQSSPARNYELDSPTTSSAPVSDPRDQTAAAAEARNNNDPDTLLYSQFNEADSWLNNIETIIFTALYTVLPDYLRRFVTFNRRIVRKSMSDIAQLIESQEKHAILILIDATKYLKQHKNGGYSYDN